MPYASNANLPSQIRRVLPNHAQDIYRSAFNHAFTGYAASGRREEIAHRVAWTAVKRLYLKRDEVWIERAAPTPRRRTS